jgi:hypothetical protein
MQVRILPGSPSSFMNAIFASLAASLFLRCSAGQGNRDKPMRSLTKHRRGVKKCPEKMFSLRFSLFSGKGSLFSETVSSHVLVAPSRRH